MWRTPLSCEMTHRFIPALSAHRGTAVPGARSTEAERSLRTGLPLRSQNRAKVESCVSYCFER